MTKSELIDGAAQRVWQAIDEMKLPFATKTSKPSAKRCWSIISRRSGSTLSVHLSSTPSTFAAMQWVKPIAAVNLGKLPKGAEVDVLRRVAAMRALPKSSRAIPLVFLAGGGTGRAADSHLCSVALEQPLEVRASFCGSTGYRADTIEHCIFFGPNELVAVVTDLFIDGVFGKVAFRHPLKDIEAARVYERQMVLTIKGKTTDWMNARPNPKAEVDAIKALLAQNKVKSR